MKKFLAMMFSLTVIMGSFPPAVLAYNGEDQDDNAGIIEEWISEEPTYDYASDPVNVGSWNELKDAVEGAGDGGSVTISLTADCTSSYDEADELLIHDERNITILLNGHTIERRCEDPCEWGRVIDIHSGSTLALIGDPESTGVRGEIRGGNCSKNGGGIYNAGTLTLEDCYVAGNKSAADGGGVYCEPGSNLIVQGFVGIMTNYSGDGDYVDDNLYLDGWVTINVTGPLDTHSVIRVSGSNLERFITTDWSNSGITDQDTVQSVVKFDDGNKTALYESGEIGLHILYMHRWVDENDQVQEAMVLPDSVPHRITETSSELTPGWYYVEGVVNIDGYISLEGDPGSNDTYNIILTNDSCLNLHSLRHYHNCYLRIYAQDGKEDSHDPSSNAGRLNAPGSEYLAGIGGGQGLACGPIEIQGGMIFAEGGDGCPGIGGESLNGPIRILGGDVEAHGGEYAAGIGTGDDDDLENSISIYGGNVSAYAGEFAAGIGSGYEADMAGSISIYGGNIYAEGMDGGACIGAGLSSVQLHYDGDWRGPISITGGTVNFKIGISSSTGQYGAWGCCIGIGIWGNREDGASLTLGDDRSVVIEPDVTHLRVTADARVDTCCYYPDPLNPGDISFQYLLIEECPHAHAHYPLDQATPDHHVGNCNACYTHPTGPHVFEDGECIICHYPQPTYSVTVNNGSSDVPAAYQGATVTITASPGPAGQAFDHWEVEPGTVVLADATSAVTTFTMPDEAVEVTAVYRDTIYNITVNNGSSNVATAVHGTTVTITADPAPAGKEFDHWEIEPGAVPLTDATSAVTTFTMPAEDVVVTAVYRDVIYNITVNNGSSDVTTAVYGTTVTITADPGPAGRAFDHWEIEPGAVPLTDATSAVTTFTMPAEDVVVTAIYRDIPVSMYSITVNNGSSDVATAAPGTTVTITAAPASAGRAFDHWEIEPGAVVLADATSAVTTFTMPAEDVVVTAIYRDIPASTYSINVYYGSADASYASPGTTVTLTANAAPAGKVFDGWVVISGGVTLADASAGMTTFSMPCENVEITATFRDAGVTAYTVTFESNGGSAVAAQTVADGSKVVKPADPTKEGFVFGGWCLNAECTVEFDFDTAVTADVTLYARWVPASGGVPSMGEESSKLPVVCFLLACASFAVAVYLRRDVI